MNIADVRLSSIFISTMQSSCCVHLEDQEYHVKSLISTKVLSFTNYQNHRLNFNQYTSQCDEYSFIYRTMVQFTNRSLSEER